MKMFSFSVLLGVVYLGELAGQDNIPRKPVLSVNPHYGVFLDGEIIALTCECQCPIKMVHYYDGWELLSVALPTVGKCEASVIDLVDTRQSYYTCECVNLWNERESARSDAVTVYSGVEPAAPTIKKEVDMTANSNGENVFVSCKGDIRQDGGTFYLYKCASEDFEQRRVVTGGLQHVTFSINTTRKNFAGNYCCGYLTEVLGDLYRSPLSKPLAVTEEDKCITSKSWLRHYFSAIVLMLLVLIVVEHFVSACHRKAEKPLEGTDASSLRNSEMTVDVSPL